MNRVDRPAVQAHDDVINSRAALLAALSGFTSDTITPCARSDRESDALTPIRLRQDQRIDPITSPSALTTGPPLLPRLIGASVWIVNHGIFRLDLPGNGK